MVKLVVKVILGIVFSCFLYFSWVWYNTQILAGFVIDGYVNKIHGLLSSRYRPFYIKQNGVPIYFYALKDGVGCDLDILNAFKLHGFELDALSSTGGRLLIQEAVLVRDETCFEWLLVNSKDPGYLISNMDSIGHSVLFDAVLSGSEKIISILYEMGADFTVRDIGGNSPLMYAVKSNNIALVKKILAIDPRSACSPNLSEVHPIEISKEERNMEISKLLENYCN